jgi:hypothetical protein
MTLRPIVPRKACDFIFGSTSTVLEMEHLLELDGTFFTLSASKLPRENRNQVI